MPSTDLPIIARAIERSGNRKIGDVAATYASQASCPSVCPLRGAGCYAEGGRAAFTTRRLNDADPNATALQVARAEAREIDALQTTRPLRLHVVGDCPTDATARIVSAAAERFIARGGGPVWTYTHAWRTVKRESWGAVSVLASVESIEDARKARARGYAPAMVRAEHPSDRAEVIDGARVIPCAEQTRGRTCVECRLCFDDGALRDRDAVIAFEVHGARKAAAREAVA